MHYPSRSLKSEWESLHLSSSCFCDCGNTGDSRVSSNQDTSCDCGNTECTRVSSNQDTGVRMTGKASLMANSIPYV